MDHRRAVTCWLIGALFLQVVLVQPALAQEAAQEAAAPAFQPPTATSRIRRLLKQREALVADGACDEVIDLTEELQLDLGDEWISHRKRLSSKADGANQYETVARYCQRLFLTASPEGLTAYRRRVDPIAERWLREGIEQLDESLLHRLTDELLASSYGDDALLALGELALQSGDTAAARRYWRQIHPRLWGPRGKPIGVALADLEAEVDLDRLAKIWDEISRPTDLLVYPDSDIPIADVLTRLCVASLRNGDTERAAVELQLLEALAPSASGRLAGRVQPYGKAIAEMIDLASSTMSFSGSESERLGALSSWAWPEFVTAERAKLNPQQQRAKQMAAGQQMARRRLLLNQQALLRQRGLAAGNRWAIPPAKVPTSPPMTIAASAKQVVFVDAKGLQGIDIATGETSSIVWPGDPAPDKKLAKPSEPVAEQKGGNRIIVNGGRVIIRGGVQIQGGQVQWFGGQQGSRNLLLQHQVLPQTLALSGEVLYAVRTELATERTERRISRVQQETLVGLDLASDAKLVLEIKAKEIEEGKAYRFCGPPVVHGDRLYLMLTDRDSLSRLSVACFSRVDGRLVWRRALGTGQPLTSMGEITRTATLAGDTLYAVTHLGAVVALEAKTGDLRWLTQYERLPITADRTNQEASPCIVRDDRLYVAPMDSQAVMAMDTVTGRTLWTADLPEGAASVVGVAGKSLVLAGRRVASYDTSTGRQRFVWPESDHAGIRGKGRALLAGGELFWPTRDRVFILNPTTGRFTRAAIDLEPLGSEGANLFRAGNQLVAAGPEKINLRGPIPAVLKELEPGLSRLRKEPSWSTLDDLLAIHSGR